MNEALRQATSGLDWNNPATMISFAVDNNPKGVAYALLQNGYDIQGLEIDQYKDLMLEAYNDGKDMTWVGSIPFMSGAGNWTGEIYNQAMSTNQGAKVDWGTIGAIAAAALPIIGGVLALFGVGGSGSGGNNSGGAIPPPGQPGGAPLPEKTIMGLEPGLFWGIAIVVFIILVLFLYMMMRRK